MGKKKTIAVLFGGKSGEHEVSLLSAASVVDAMDRNKYDIVLVGIDKEGNWWTGDNLLEAFRAGKKEGARTAVLPGSSEGGLLLFNDGNIEGTIKLDAVFPVLHGPYGEDGTVQGLLELAGIPYVGAGVLGSAVGMDKAAMKLILAAKGLPVANYLYFVKKEFLDGESYWLETIAEKIGFPCFVKPANLGSSVGISLAGDRQELLLAIREALRYDLKVVVEERLKGKEIECSVLGNYDPKASIPGEIIPSNEFYDYQAKYIDNKSKLIIPAPLSAKLTEEVRFLAVETFKALDCFGLGRVDFFVDPETEKIYINEINTLPGFTNISMYPKLWEASGLKYTDLIDKLIDLAFARYAAKQELLTSYAPPENIP
ncbi:MAG TPA: D-alanine--D-alanine ligase [Firmicutes bacterium]|nr:D-alanine--D-alanine ligase [Bacillota bacterium]